MTIRSPRFGKSFTLALNRIVLRSFYNIKITGTENIPKSGGGLIVSNHLSWADAPLLLYAFKRPIRFFIFREIHEKKLVNAFTEKLGCIPISFEDNPKNIIRAFNTAREAISNGELVGIFPEGKCSTTGQLLAFQKGISKLLEARIIPVNISGLAGSFMTPPLGPKNKRKLFGKIAVAVGEPITEKHTASDVRQKVMDLGRQSFRSLFPEKETLGRALSRKLSKSHFKIFFEDSSGRKLTGLSLHWAAGEVAKSMKGEFGILLPTSCAAVIATVAAAYKGVPVVHLNYTADPNYPVKAARLTQVLTSRLFLKKLNIELDCDAVYIEDILKKPNFWKILACFFRRPRFTGHLDDTAAILFTSGSTSLPKGVLLSNLNLLSNTKAVAAAYNILPGYRMLGLLPPFHSFGLTGNIILPLLTGMKCMLHHNPLEATKVGEIVKDKEHKPEVLLATPTFLALWERKLGAELFRDIEYLVTGSEPLPEALGEKFKIFQGYGCTENSPVISVAVEGDDPRSCGRVVSGTSIEVRPVEGSEYGKVFISGTSLMKGYLGHEPQPEWYETGDLGELKDDGTLFITGRESRFSKIAGEMVSHQAIEEAISEEVLVVGVPDEKKGEKIYCLHECELDPGRVKEQLKAAKLPNIAIPALVKVDELPKTGTGKPNLGEAKKIVTESGS